MSVGAVVVGGGQSGLAAAGALARRGVRPVLIEAHVDPTGSWSRYYESLRLFTPAGLNALPGRPFPADDAYFPSRDEMAGYLRDYAATLDCEVRTRTRVEAVTRHGSRFVVRTDRGDELGAGMVVAATGQFDNPHRPDIPGLRGYTGPVLHAADYREPHGYAGRRIVVVGSGNSAVQIASELAEHARVSIASRAPIRYATEDPVPGDSRFWTVLSLAGRVPAGRWFGAATVPVIDTMGYRARIDAGRPDRRDLPVRAEGRALYWPDGSVEAVDLVLLATGYRPALDYLAPLGLRYRHRRPGVPAHRAGVSLDHPGLGFVGLDNQRTFLSATLLGVGRDATYVAARLT
ncbi:flavin-containing monooxygenase [Pseudonocardia endophytica]|uniref:Putative flavoprotein involved in K+ transport n=1 Tax=Pseudonocardia endophytica TaxID=401976 RepID=A0A4R1HPY3_PSEEN|nr:NAD(P)/FAD-dependent oxidoreductase [Pseudonocardia endophytica]TCK24624.1 putative flavoprotein involved in K+ transport [Pseudonocardia endophytica]